jgi:DNA-binding HxlR family transcriptional regulator
MRWSEIGSESCSVARTLAVIGDRWTLMILRNCFLGSRRFGDFQQHPGAARNLIADRLSKLVDAGILERRVYQQRPERHEYLLTPKGRALQPVMLALVAWGDDWTDDGSGPPIENVHTTCGQPMHQRGVCSECGELLTSRNVQPRPGPGAPHLSLPLRLATELGSGSE